MERTSKDHLSASALWVGAKAEGIDSLELKALPQAIPRLPPEHVLVEVHAAAVNPSDVKATLGIMPQAVFPRIPGRDFAGIVVDGPSALIGLKVWGSGGDLGITRDGSHGHYLVLPQSAVRPSPSGLDLDEAGSVGVPFVTACDGLTRAGGMSAGQTVVVFGANGKVGQAVVQIAARAGARVIAVQRRDALHGIACAPVEVVNAAAIDPADRILELTSGRGADLVFNTVDRAYWQAGHAVMAKGAVQIFIIATKGETVPFDLFRFYRNMHRFVGVDTLGLDAVKSCALLDTLRPGFEDGTLRPYPVLDENKFDLTNAATAYRRVLAGAADRMILKPKMTKPL
jgi:NADPH:quinone reductase-like Zn-dependent oxidoreductase